MTTQTKTKNSLTAKQEAFTILLFQGLYQRDAYVKVYHPTYSQTAIDANASRLANNDKVLARLDELRDAVATDAIATVQERHERLTEFIRANVVDFIGEDGKPQISKSIPHHAAVAEYEVKQTKYGVSRSIKLRDPIAAISELNKMEHIYEPGGNIRDINVVFVIGKGYSELPLPAGKLIERGSTDDAVKP